MLPAFDAAYRPLQLPLIFFTELTCSVCVALALALIDPALDVPVEPAGLPAGVELLLAALESIVPRTSTREFRSFSRSLSLPTRMKDEPDP